MANLDATLIYTDSRQDDPLTKYCLRPQPSSESLRTRLNALADPIKHKRCNKRRSLENQSPRLLHLSKKLLQIKPQIVKEQEDEVKKITRERIFRGKQLDSKLTPLPSPLLVPSASSSGIGRFPNLPNVCLHPKRVGQQQINLIKDQINIIKQDINQIYPDIPSPKNDAWFRLDELDSLTEVTQPTRSHSFSSRIPQQSRVFVEKSVTSLNRKIKSIKRNNSQSSSLAASRHTTTDNNPLLAPSALTEPSSHNLSPTPSLTNSSVSIPTPDTNQSKHSPSFRSASPSFANQIPSPPSFLENSQWGARHPFSAKGKLLAFPGAITENDESIDHGERPASTGHLAPDNRPQATSLDLSRTSCSSTPPMRLSIVTQGISDAAEPSTSRRSFNHTPLGREPGTSLSPVYSSTPISCLDSVIMRSQRKMSPFELLLEESQTQNVRRRTSLSSKIAKPSVSSASNLLDRNRAKSRSSRSLARDSITQLQSPNILINQHVQLSIPFVNSPSEIETHSQDSIRFWKSNIARTGLNDFEFFVKKDSSNHNQVLLVTDVLIEQQGGLSFLGQENFNERFRSKPWQTMKTIYQYDRPGRPDAEYIPGVSRVEVVQTPHSPETFPLPTPEWYWVTDFTIDRQSRPVDGNGWEYYDLFSRKWSPRRHGCRTFVRRRWWVRVRAKLRDAELDETAASRSSSSLSPKAASSCSNSEASSSRPKSVVVTLMKVGTEETILFNASDVSGGHSLTIDELPEGQPSIEIHWDDSSLIPTNPLFSSHIFKSEIIHRLISLNNQRQLTPLQLDQINQVLDKALSLINLKRIEKTFRGLSEHQKIRLWKFWFDLTSSTHAPPKSSSTFIYDKPDVKDVWKIIDQHFEKVLELFTFDVYRVKFLHLIQKITNKNKNENNNNNQTMTTEKQHRRSKTMTNITTTTLTTNTRKLGDIQLNNNNNNNFEGTLRIDIRQVRMDFWSNFVTFSIDFNNNNKSFTTTTSNTNQIDFGNINNLLVSFDIRNYLIKLIKSYNNSNNSKFKRSNLSISK